MPAVDVGLDLTPALLLYALFDEGCTDVHDRGIHRELPKDDRGVQRGESDLRARHRRIHDPWTVIFAMPERLDAGFDARHRSAELTILRRNACRFSRSVGEPTKNVN